MALLEILVPSIGNASRRRAGQRLEPPAQLKARERRRFNQGETARQRQREAHKYQN